MTVYPLNLSIIVPLLNEADNLPELIAHIVRLDPAPQQVILVDGGSVDGSVAIADSVLKSTEVAQSIIDWHVIESTVGRAQQMNAGAILATGDV